MRKNTLVLNGACRSLKVDAKSVILHLTLKRRKVNYVATLQHKGYVIIQGMRETTVLPTASIVMYQHIVIYVFFN